MLQDIEVTSPVERKLKIEIPTHVLDKEINDAYRELRTTVNIPGFRKGKAPQFILEKRFGKKVEAEIMGKLVQQFYVEAVKEAGITPISAPNIDGELQITKNTPLIFSVNVEVKPEIKDLNYEGIEIEEKDITVNDEDVEQALKSIQEQKAVFEPAEKDIAEGDMVVIDYSASIDEKEIEELGQKDYQFIIGSSVLPEEFTELLITRKKNESLEIPITFKEDFQNKTIAGKKVIFNVFVKEVKKKITANLDDDFALDIGYDNLLSLKEALKEKIKKQKETDANAEYKNIVIEKVLEMNKIEVPPSMAKNELELLLGEAKKMAEITGQDIGNPEELRKTFQQKAIKNVETALLIDKIGSLENIEINEDDFNKEINKIASEMSLTPEEFKKKYIAVHGSLDGLRLQFYNDTVMNGLLSKVKFRKT